VPAVDVKRLNRSEQRGWQVRRRQVRFGTSYRSAILDLNVQQRRVVEGAYASARAWWLRSGNIHQVMSIIVVISDRPEAQTVHLRRNCESNKGIPPNGVSPSEEDAG